MIAHCAGNVAARKREMGRIACGEKHRGIV